MKEWHKSRTFGEALHHAWAGVLEVYKRESNVRRQMGVLLLALVAGVLLRLAASEFALIFIAAGLVLGLEFINSALEEIEDLIWPEYREAIRRSKDIAAGAVLVASVTAAIVGLFIFIPHLAKLVLLVY